VWQQHRAPSFGQVAWMQVADALQVIAEDVVERNFLEHLSIAAA
jgi:hypothetical protein